MTSRKTSKGLFGSLKEGNNFADVTLACEDDQQVEAHKVILAASSLFSRICLEGTRRLKSEDFLAVVKASTVVKAISLLLTCEEYQPSECREEKCGDKCLGRGRVLGRGE